MFKRIFLHCLAFVAAGTFAAIANATTLVDHSSGSITTSFNFDYSGLQQLKGGWREGIAPFQILLNQTEVQNFLHQLGSELQDPLLQKLIADLEGANFQITQQLQTDFNAWRQSHSFNGNLTDLCDWLNQQRAPMEFHTDGPFLLPTALAPVPEPDTALLVVFGALGAFGILKLRGLSR